MSRTDGRHRLDVALALVLFAFGLALSLHYGRRGFMPLDQSIVWDAGWRVLDGQVPFRDFVTTTSLVPGVLQAGFFGVMGVSWLAYCLHAAVFNGVFAVFTFALLRSQDLHPAAAVVFGATAAVFFYPPFGVPYGDQHSFFFGLLALLLCALALRAESAAPSRAPVLWLLVPAAVLLGYLSKPIPVAFLLPALAVAALWPGERWTRRVGLLVLGAALSVALVAAVLGMTGADLALAWDYLVRLPLELGGQRGGRPGFLPDRLRAMLHLGGRSGILFPRAAFGASLLVLAGLATLTGLGRKPGRKGLARVWAPLLLGGLMWAGTAVFVGVTRNQARNGHALLPVVLGLQAAALARLAPLAGDLHRRMGPWLRRAALLGVAGLVGVALHDAVRFNATVNVTRLVHDATFERAQAVAARDALPPALAFMQWSRPPAPYAAADLARLVDAVAAEPAPVLLVSDSLIVYGLAGKPSVNPNLWYHPGVSMPRRDDRPRIERLETLFLERLDAARPGLVVFDPPPGASSFDLSVLPRVEAALAARRCGHESIGPFPAWRLCWDGASGALDTLRADRPS